MNKLSLDWSGKAESKLVYTGRCVLCVRPVLIPTYHSGAYWRELIALYARMILCHVINAPQCCNDQNVYVYVYVYAYSQNSLHHDSLQQGNNWRSILEIVEINNGDIKCYFRASQKKSMRFDLCPGLVIDHHPSFHSHNFLNLLATLLSPLTSLLIIHPLPAPSHPSSSSSDEWQAGPARSSACVVEVALHYISNNHLASLSSKRTICDNW